MNAARQGKARISAWRGVARPCFHNWSLTFTLLLDTEVMDCKLLRDIVDAAGKRIGLGDFRLDCKGPFGKFVVDSWAEDSA